ncbi:MAG: DUF4126 domain-containing protein [Pseudomonadota bacterium]
MEAFVAILTGVGLAAACGFRVFVPLFLVSLSLNTGVEMPFGLDTALRTLLNEEMQWLGDPLVTTGLGVATLVEVGGFYVPWVDNLLDALATPAAGAAGTFISGAFMPELLGDGYTKWAAALIAGGGASGLVQVSTVLARGASSASTGGLGNPLVATFELFSAVVTTILAVLIPLLVIALLIAVIFMLRKLFRDRDDDEKPINDVNGDPPAGSAEL